MIVLLHVEVISKSNHLVKGNPSNLKPLLLIIYLEIDLLLLFSAAPRITLFDLKPQFDTVLNICLSALRQ